ncbi:TonB-dependent receptor [Niveispirillum sp. BGYR6]|uniref:TonB-dependent receptor domain-containing protein n=1 Tax=Niveispirillum sp. BGYR6 TaxID=2971249 RepID=UPI0022B95819|nr:TonB-dependent receptor [Niveispirillum sp. BGYR6]MDG5496451.1 TonB-dependent receptor [Niveispirillum sp. BGYR6]
MAIQYIPTARRFRSVLLAGVAAGLVTALPAQAQQSAPTSAATQPIEEIVVTGSRIRRPNVDSAVPVTSVPAEAFSETGTVSVGDVLNDLPALRSTFSTGNSSRFIGTSGLNLLDLRGLGTSRTLVLQNGRRHIGALEGTNEVDVNMIPTDLIERVDVVTGGSSAIYGSDAIAGVVNFVLKNDFEGAKVRAQYGSPEDPGGDSYFVSATLGTNFDNDKGNIALSVEQAKQKQIKMKDRDWTRSRQAFVINESPANEPGGTDGIPDRIFVRDMHSVLLSEGGSVIPGCPASLTGAARDLRCKPGSNIARVYRFRPDGTLAEADYGSRDFRPNANTTDGGDGTTLRRYGQLQPEIRRMAVNAVGHYTISDAFVPFFEAKFVRNQVTQESSPSFNQSDLILGLDNPYLSSQARTLLNSIVPGTSPSRTFSLNRNNLDLGSRVEDITRETYRGVVGVRGEFNNDWNYEFSLNYGHQKKTLLSGGNRVEQRFAFATDAVRDASGKIVCRVTVDPSAREALAPELQKYLADDVANCVPLNPFGEGAMTGAARNYVMTQSKATGKQTQFVAGGFLSGDSSDLFELPAGPVGFAVGGEYRRQTAYQEYDQLVRDGGTFLNAIPIFDPPSFEVKEAYGEINVPLLKDLPFAEELSAQGAVRYSDYKGSTGSTLAWNAGGTWSPHSWIRFRGNYSVAVRAPNQDELYSSPTQSFASINDPCDVNFISSGTSSRPTNCAAAGIPAGFVNELARLQTAEIRSGGNPNLTEEKSKATTLGFVLTPDIIPGFTFAADYFDIKVDDVIESVDVQDIVNLCYDAASLNNAFCQLIQRQPAGSKDPRTGESNAFYFVPGGILQSSLNYAKRTSRGIDFDTSYNTDIGDLGTLELQAIATYTILRNNYPNVLDPNFKDQVLLELGDPKWSGQFSAKYKTQGFTFGYQLQYIGKMSISPDIEAIKSVQGRPPQDADYATDRWYPSVFYHDVRVGYDINEGLNVYAGVDNVFDKEPPFGLTGTGEGSGIYQNRGRFFYAGVVYNF